MSEFMHTCNMDERTNKEILRDNKLCKEIEAMIYEHSPYENRTWITDDGLPYKIIELIEKTKRVDR